MSEITKVYIPNIRIVEALEVFLLTEDCVPKGMEVIKVDVNDNPFAYLEHLQNCWDKGEPFINIEHDIIPWPGALQHIAQCSQPWCFYGYLPDIDFVASNAAPFGLVKFEAEFIAQWPNVWKDMIRTYRQHGWTNPWRCCDTWLRDQAMGAETFTPHQHFPAVLNANPSVLEFQDTSHDGHEHTYIPSPWATTLPPALICTYPGCLEFQTI